MNRKTTILAGITQDNELYFINIEKQTQEHPYFAMTGETVTPILKTDAIERCREYLEDDTEQWKMAVEADQTTLGQQEWADYVISVEGELVGFDNSLFDEEVEVHGEDYIFESGSCGQHQENDIKHFLMDEKLFRVLMKIWDKYHLTDNLKSSGSDTAIIEEAMQIKQDIPTLAKQAVEIINNQ